MNTKNPQVEATRFEIWHVDTEPLFAQWGALQKLIEFIKAQLYGQPFLLESMTYERGTCNLLREEMPEVCIYGYVQGPKSLIEAINKGEKMPDYMDYHEQREAVQRLLPGRRPTYGAPWRLLADELRELQAENAMLRARLGMGHRTED